MKKIIVLLAVVVVVLGAGQFYSASKFKQMLEFSEQAIQKQGFKLSKNELDSGWFNSTYDMRAIAQFGEGFEIVEHLEVSHLPWGANYNGTLDIVISADAANQRLFADIMDTDPVIFDGSYNPFSGGRGSFTFAKFNLSDADLRISMPKPVVLNFTHSNDFKIVNNDFVIDSLSIKGADDIAIEAQNISVAVHQDHVWPEDDFMHSSGVISVGKFAINEPLKQSAVTLNASKLDFTAAVATDGNASYSNALSVGAIKIIDPVRANSNADAKLDFKISAVNIKALQKMLRQFQQLDFADEAAVSAFMQTNRDNLQTAIATVLQQSKPVIELRELTFNSDNDAMKSLKAKGIMNIDSSKIDIGELLASNVQAPQLGYGAGKYLLDKFTLEFDASGNIKGMLPGPYGDKIKLRVKDGTISINDQQLKL